MAKHEGAELRGNPYACELVGEVEFSWYPDESCPQVGDLLAAQLCWEDQSWVGWEGVVEEALEDVSAVSFDDDGEWLVQLLQDL